MLRDYYPVTRTNNDIKAGHFNVPSTAEYNSLLAYSFHGSQHRVQSTALERVGSLNNISDKNTNSNYFATEPRFREMKIGRSISNASRTSLNVFDMKVLGVGNRHYLQSFSFLYDCESWTLRKSEEREVRMCLRCGFGVGF